MKAKFNRKDVSSWCKWIAVDKDGKCWEYPTKPFASSIFSIWGAASFSKGKILYKGAPPKNWKDELYTWE